MSDLTPELIRLRDTWIDKQCELHDKNGPTGVQDNRTWKLELLDQHMLMQGFNHALTKEVLREHPLVKELIEALEECISMTDGNYVQIGDQAIVQEALAPWRVE